MKTISKKIALTKDERDQVMISLIAHIDACDQAIQAVKGARLSPNDLVDQQKNLDALYMRFYDMEYNS